MTVFFISLLGIVYNVKIIQKVNYEIFYQPFKYRYIFSLIQFHEKFSNQQCKIKPTILISVKIKQMVPQLSRYQLCWGAIGCIGGLFVQLVIGSLYQWGIINIYITSYYKINDEDLTLEDNAIAFPVMMSCIGIMMRIGLYLSQITHPLIMMLINVIIQAGSIFASSYVSSMAAFIVLYGVIFGLSAGLQFMIPIVECNKYLPGRKMYVNGVILIGTGLGSVVFGPFSYGFLNPNKEQPLEGYYYGNQKLEQIAKKVPQCLRYLSLLYLIIGILGILMLWKVCMHNRQHQKALKQEKYRQQQKKKHQKEKQQMRQQQKMNQTQQILIEESKKQKTNTDEGFIIFQVAQPVVKQEIFAIPPEKDQEIHPQRHKNQAHTIKQAVTSQVFWVQAAVLFFGSCGVFLVNGNYKTYVKKDISNDQFLTIIGVVGSIGNGCSRFFWNLLFNHTGYKTVMSINLFIQIIVYAVVRYSIKSNGAYLFLVFLVNCCLGGLLVMAPTTGQSIFGQKTGSNIYGFYWTVFALANFLQYAFVAGIADKISFDGIIYICLGMTVVSLIILNLFTFEGPWKNSTKQLRYCIRCQNDEEAEEQKQAQTKQKTKM